MNVTEIFAVSRGDIIHITLTGNITVSGEVMENTIVTVKDGVRQQRVVIQDEASSIYTVQRIVNSGRERHYPLQGQDVSGYIKSVVSLDSSKG